jgi:predicted CXXCH cytochrome family protein
MMVSQRLRVAGMAALFAGALALWGTAARAEDPFCFDCHDDFPKKMKGFAFKHDPAAGGDCLACHVDHKDEEKLILKKEGAALCYECHDDMSAGKSVHAPVAGGKCTSCHNPHGSMNKKMLVASPKQLCEKCHAGSPEFKRKVTHTALEDGCSDCHRPHSSENPKLLAKNLVMDRLALFDPKQAELCFSCHDEKNFTTPRTEDTGFRIGQTSLHSLHLMGGATPNKYGIIKKKDGQTCFACHLPHTADQEMMLRTEYQCTGTFCYTMRYVKNDKGGTCIVGCHKPRTYSRDGQDPNSTAGLMPAAPAGDKPALP